MRPDQFVLLTEVVIIASCIAKKAKYTAHKNKRTVHVFEVALHPTGAAAICQMAVGSFVIYRKQTFFLLKTFVAIDWPNLSPHRTVRW